MTGELPPQNCLQRHLACLVVDFWGFCSIISGVACIVRLHPDYQMRATVSKQKFSYSVLYILGLEDQFSATKDVVVHLDIFESSQHDSACFGGTCK